MSRNLGTLKCDCGGYDFSTHPINPDDLKLFQDYLTELGVSKLSVFRDNWGSGWGTGHAGSEPFYVLDAKCPACGARYAVWVRRYPNEFKRGLRDQRDLLYDAVDMSYYETFSEAPPR